ncbi:MAG TPA: alkaline phosphatase family protein [Candidatus Saccharimonadales bacterium]|nr:alkaline phosphatase family protein [Candidatus Saccharimonadales bacterium]
MRYTFRATPLQYIAYSVVSALLLAVVLNVFTSISAENSVSILIVVILIQIIQILIQPIFSLIAKFLGVLGILLVSLFGFSFIVWGALELVPGIENVSFIGSLIASWVYAAIVTILQWVIIAQSHDYFLQQAIKRSKKKKSIKTKTAGFVFVQLDGVSAPVLKWQLNAGNLPNIKKIIDSGAYNFTAWNTQLPSTTPASQAGILHGSHLGIPAFRWYERKTDELVVANQSKGAALIEQRLSNGRGLLADGGISIGNLFSGDAPSNIMVISKLNGDRKSISVMSDYTDYFSSLYGFMRVFILSIGEMIKEIYQGQRQRIRDVQPRVPRKGSYILLRAGTNVLLRDLQTTIVVDQMMQGTNSIYVDYLDYDEIAHHAGLARPESMAALSGLDNIVGILTRAALSTPRPYHVVFVSDHGQSQGPTFKTLNDGNSLEMVLGDLIGTDAIHSSTAPIEQESIPRTLLAQSGSGKGITGSASRKLDSSYSQKTKSSDKVSSEKVELVVTGSGNLGNVWLKQFASRPTRQQIENKYPGLIDKLLKTKGIGLVLVMDENKNPIMISKHGQINLMTGKVAGTDPLRIYKNIRIQELLNIATDPNAPDLQIISAMQFNSGEVYAFEELVGNHGGIGGWQTEALLLYPSQLKIDKKYYDNGELYDSTTIHNIFVSWLTKAGHRQAQA